MNSLLSSHQLMILALFALSVISILFGVLARLTVEEIKNGDRGSVAPMVSGCWMLGIAALFLIFFLNFFC